MCKKHVLLLLLFALFAPWAANAEIVEIIGDGGTTNNQYLPGYNYYNYSLTQQIYTVDEIGMAGTINSIAFQNTGSEKTRSYNIYMLLTDKESFSGGTDWVAMSEDDLVFSGELTFAVGEWTTIDLDSPFAYDGSSNLIVGVADMTGSYSNSPHMACLVFEATGQAIRAYRDSGSYDITNPGVSGTVLNVKNQIQLDITSGGGSVCEKPETLTLNGAPEPYSVTLAWSETSGTYNIEYKKASDSEWTERASNYQGLGIMLVELEPGTDYQARVQSVCTDGVSGWKSINFSTPEVCPDGMVCIGTGIATNNNLPANNYYKYSLTEQIYTADEIGEAGAIMSIDFYKAATIEMVKDLDIYIVSTNKDEFESNTDWIPVTASDLVYSGAVTFIDNDWTTIEFESPFFYDGTSNICIVVDNNTGSYKSNTAFRVFTASNNQTLYYQSDNDNLDPTTTLSQSASGKVAQKNRIRIAIGEPPACAKPTGLAVEYSGGTEATVSWNSEATAWNMKVNGTEINGTITNPYTLTGLELATTYTVEVQADCDGTTSDWTSPVSFTTDLCMPEDQCEITFTLTDSYGDGWNGAYIKVVDVLTGAILGEMANQNLDGTNGEETQTVALAMCNGREIRFEWVSGSYDGEASYVVTDHNGDEIFAGTGAMSAPVNYTVDCSVPTCLKPINLAASLTEGDGTIATLTWTEVNGATDWVLQYGTDAAFAEGSYTEVTEGFIVVVDTTAMADTSIMANLTGLTAETVYYTRVKAVCSEDDQSDWSRAISFRPSNYFYLTVNEDVTTTNSYIPIYYSVSYNQGRSQFIIPSTDLTAMQWGEIGGLKFYNTLESANYGDATFKVYVAEVDYTTMNAFADWASLTEVYSGTVTINDNIMEIVFDEPFPYNDGNLLIGFYKTANGTNPSTNYWYGVEGVSGNSRYATYSETSSNFLPATTFAYAPNPDPVFHEITVEANPEEGGTVTGGGEMLEGRTVTLTATADHFYEFVNWTKDGVVVDTVNPLTVTVTEDATYVANFNALPTFTVTITANLENAGEYGIIADTNLFLAGETCTVYAIPNEGYEFKSWVNAAGQLVTEDASFELTVTNDTAFMAIFQMYPFELTATPDPIDIGERPSGAWMRPFPFSLTNSGVPDEVISFEFDNDFFGVDLGEHSLPFNIGFQQTLNFGMTWGTAPASGPITGHLTVGYGSEGETQQFDVAGTVYVPVEGDVWENPFVVSSFPYTSTVDATTMHDNYVLPLADIEDGNEVVYQLTFTEDAILSASVTEGENGKVILYEEGFQGIGGPDEENFFVGGNRSGGNRDAVVLTVHDGTATSANVPVHGNWADAYLKCETLYPADELVEMVNGDISMITYYTSTPASGAWTGTFQVFMMEVDETTLTAYHDFSNATPFYEGQLDGTGSVMEIEFVTPYHYNGGNLLIAVYQTVSGNYKNVYWYGETVTGASIQGYNSSSLDGVTVGQRNFLPKTTFTYEPAPTIEPAIEDLTLMPGVYYLVASSTSDQYTVSIETAALPCPEVAYEPTPADGAIEVSDVNVTLKWNLSDYTTSYTLLFGTDPEELEPLVEWTRELQSQYAIEDTLDLRTTYYWQVAEKNDGCPDGVYSDVWSFTTTFTSPNTLATLTGETAFAEGEEVQLVWEGASEHRVEMIYEVYQDNVSIATTADTTFIIEEMPYGIHNYKVAAHYTLDTVAYERFTNTLTIAGVHFGAVEGFVYEADGEQVIPDATVIIYGNDDLGLYREYEFTTDEAGYYTGEMATGYYTGIYAIADGYESNSPENTTLVTLGAYDFEDQALIVGAETGTDYPWVITDDDNHTEDGQYALRSGNKNAHSTVSYVGMYVTYAEADTLSFACKISSEASYDKGYFSIDNAVQSDVNGISGNGSWMTCSYPMTAGTHLIIWYYAKDNIMSENDDCFYIDDVDFGTGTVEGILIESGVTTSDVNFYLNDVLYTVEDLYVSRTGYAMWEGLGEETGGTRHFNNAEVYLSPMVAETDTVTVADTIYVGSTTNNYMQLPAELLENGNSYWCHVRQTFTSGESQMQSTLFAYQSCDNFEGGAELEGVLDATGVTLTWEYPVVDSTAVGEPIGAFLFRNGEWVDFVAADNYLDAEGEINTVYEMRVVYGGEMICPDNNIYYSMSCLDTIPVRYAQYEISATVEPAEAGEVTGTGLLNYSSTAELTAIAAEGYTFDHWTTAAGDAVEGGEILTFTVEEPAAFVAHFTLNNYAIAANANPIAGGTIAGAGNYDHFETCTLIATAAEGYHFVNWTLEEDEVSTADTLSFEVTGPATYVANFELNSYEITAFANPEDGGIVEGAGTYNHFDVVTLTATAAEGYHFMAWTKDGEEIGETETISDTVTGPAEYVAYFEINNYDIYVVANPEEGGIVEGAGNYDHFQEVTLTATANEGYHFVNWELDGVEVGTDTTYTFTMTGEAYYVANFELNSYEITAVADPEVGGTVEGAGTYNHFDEVTLVAEPAEGYTFMNWTMDGVVVAETETYTFEVEGPAAFVANFEQIVLNVTVTANPTEGGIVTGSGEYVYGTEVTLTATAAEGYNFLYWADATGALVAEENTYIFNVFEDVTFVAVFEQKAYNLYVIAEPAEGGEVSGEDVYFYGDQVTLTAEANDGYTFVNWTYNGDEVSTEAVYTFTVDDETLVEGDENEFVAHFELNSYEIIAVANPEEGGIVTGAGTYDYGTEVTLTAEANEGYTFVNWTMDGLAVSYDLSYSFVVDGPAEYVANFEINSYEITAVANPEDGGTIEGAGTYNHFDVVTLTATAAEGYHFLNWTMDGETLAETEIITDTVTGPAEYVANFELNSYEITVSVDPEDGGTITGDISGTYNHFDEITLSAQGTEGYTFLNWTKNGTQVSTSPEFIAIVTGEAEYVAHFSHNAYVVTVDVNMEEAGTVTGTGGYDHGDIATLEATANEGYTFINWTDASGAEVSTENPFELTVTETATYIANFEINSYEITAVANPEEGGTVEGAGSYDYGTEVTLTATVNEGYTFMNWTLDGEMVAETESFSFTVTEAADYVANFEQIVLNVVATANPTEGGIVTGSGEYVYGTEVTLTATAAEGYNFLYWADATGALVDEETTYTFNVYEDATFVAVFELKAYDLYVIAEPEEGGEVSGEGTYFYGDQVELTANAAEGYTFVNWTYNGEEVSTDAIYTFTVDDETLVEGDENEFVAHFALNTFEITAVANPEEGGTITGAGTYEYGTEVTLTATANEGYTFINWTMGNETVGTDESLVIEVTGEAEYVANFELNSYEITAVANPEEGGTVEGAGTYNHFDVVILTATAAEGYTFLNWTKDGVMFAETETVTDTVTGPAAYVANFELNMFEITAVANPEEGGIVTGAGIYNYGTEVTLTAEAYEGYTFINWTMGNEMVSTNATLTITVTEDAEYLANFELNSYEITAVANPEEGGTVTGAGTYDHGTQVTLTATANEGYTFVSWTMGNEVVSMETTYSFTVTEDADYVANFELNSYDITVVANPEEGGTVTGAGTYDHGTQVTLTATAATGYTFLNWTLGNEVVATDATYSFTATEDAEYVANFEINSYEITAAANPEEGGTVTGAGTYDYGTVVTLTAEASEGYTFMNWTLNGQTAAETESFSFTVTEDADYVANFELIVLNVVATAEPTEGGTITGAGEYDYGTEVTLTATANEGYTFLNWTNGNEVIVDNPYIFNVTEDAEFVANFELNSYEITVIANPEEGGIADGTGTYNHFEEVTLMAEAYEGYTFINWTLGNEVVSTDEILIIEVTGDAEYVANFELNSYDITVTANPTAGGTVTGAGTYNHFEEVTLTATAATGYTFLNWTLDGEVVAETESYSFTVTEAADFVANFELNSYEITAVANPEVGGTIEGAGTYNHFEVVTLTATAAEGYTFVNWTLNGAVVATTPSFSLTVAGPAAYVANFELNSYDITVVANPTAGGTVAGAGTYNHFEEVTLTATAAEGYSFINWSMNGQTVSYDATYTFTVTGGGEYVANFELNSYEIIATANPTVGGTIEGAGTYNHFETAILTATAATGYDFVNWTLDGQVISESETFIFQVTGPASYVANFELSNYEITAVAEPEEGGTVDGAGTYTYMSTCMLTATANTGYTFLNWTLDGQVVSTTATFIFQVTGPADYIANFEVNSYEITVVANPEEGGSVTGAGTYDYGTEITLVATANEGYTFINWTKGNEMVSTEESLTITVTEAADYLANFELNSYEITAVANPEVGGIIEGAGIYNHFDEVTLVATPAEDYNFLNWTLDGVIVAESNEFTFTVTGPANYIANFELANITQVTDLAAGWNWWSGYVELGENGLAMLEEGLGSNGLVIKSQSSGFVNYAPGVGWYGSLANVGISNELSYQISMSQATNVELSGLAANPANHPITLYTGWTWIGYPSNTSMGVAAAFSGINPQTGDMVKSQNSGFASYLEGYGWYGALNTLEPGMGLMFKSTNSQTVTFTYGTERGELVANQKADFNHWVPDLHAYPDNMNVMAVIELNDEELRGENYELAAFANGECRGSARLLYVAPLDRYIAFLTVAGESETELYFGLYDAETGLELLNANETLAFAVNAVVGSFEEPFVVHFRNTTGTDEDVLNVHVYPNPIETGRSYSIGSLSDNSGNIRIEVINALGAVVAVEETTEFPSTFQAPATPGVYTLRITVEGKGTTCRRLVVR